ncbi:MAG: intradiol ring-cleavage dioxygenase [Saprospiraceae bacterium]|nr:intradiol ring-cleavage dioxygenase [Saprospiraceae bacterium]
MKSLYPSLFFLCLTIVWAGCSGKNTPAHQNQNNVNEYKKLVGGGCDGCEIMYIDMPENIPSVDTSSGWFEEGQKLIVAGTVFQIDGKTPAPDVILYYWQTDNKGYYSTKEKTDKKANRHGHIRGWVKTDQNGKYIINTIRPAPYPNDVLPAHIHLSVKEPDLENEYYTDEINFDDDKLLIAHFKKHKQENRGGSGVVRVLMRGNIQVAEHDIILGLNIPNYPKSITSSILSGLNIGEDQPSFIPYHAFGPDKGKQTCPVCKYGRYHGILYFVGNNPNWQEIKVWLDFLENESAARQKFVKSYFVYGNEKNYLKNNRIQELEKLGNILQMKHLALTFVPSFSDTTTEVHLNKINPMADNTFIIYKHRSIVDKYINLKPTSENFNVIRKSLDNTRGDYFELPALKHE